jgi:predicted  nucleic acid-binding Zn-ribbon protein
MLGLTIENIELSAQTNGGEFSASIPLSVGLNVIRAENSSGKSTCVNAIAYGLGLEAILGPKSKRPFPKSLYEVISDNKEEENQYYVSSSCVILTLKNSSEDVVQITRDILGNENKATVLQGGKNTDYFLGSSGNVGSAKSDRGFHKWLAEFIGWELPNVVTFDGKEVKLYIECIFSLFFIEQKRGWSEIQANIPTFYGIKNVKKTTTEFCLGIDSFEFEKKAVRLRNSITSSENEWEKLISAAEGIADFNSVIMNKIPDLGGYKDNFDVEFLYQDGSATYSMVERQRSLKLLANMVALDVSKATPDNDKLSSQQAKLRELRREAEKNSEEIEVSMLSLSDVESKISTLKNELDRYQQLRRLKDVGSLVEANLDTKTCPICESELYDTLGNRSVRREPMTLIENVEFLKNQADFYVNIKLRNSEVLKQLQSKTKMIKARADKEERELDSLRKDLNDVNGEINALLRKKIQAEIELRDAEKLGYSLIDLKSQAARIHSSWSVSTIALKKLRSTSSNRDKRLVISELLSLVKGNLKAFNFTPASIGYISISEHTLRPEQDGYDIVAETSASDYIRIIWAYTLSLLQLAGNKKDVLHGGFVVFDEPRQHEASRASFANLIDKASESKYFNGQVIFATSLDEDVLESACANKGVNLICFDDYILTLKTDSSDAGHEYLGAE